MAQTNVVRRPSSAKASSPDQPSSRTERASPVPRSTETGDIGAAAEAASTQVAGDLTSTTSAAGERRPKGRMPHALL